VTVTRVIKIVVSFRRRDPSASSLFGFMSHEGKICTKAIPAPLSELALAGRVIFFPDKEDT